MTRARLERRTVRLPPEAWERIERLAMDMRVDEIQMKRLKRRKLLLKDQIVAIMRQMDPDVPA